MSNWLRLTEVDTIADPGCRDFRVDKDGNEVEGFVVHFKGQIQAFINACPHTGVGLNWAPDEYFDIEQRYLICGLHGALFEPDSGLCVHGPCLGQSLQSWPIKIEQGVIFLKTSS